MKQAPMRNAGGLASVIRGAVRQGVVFKAAPEHLCDHGIICRRCDECGEWMAQHPGVPAHGCGEGAVTCAMVAQGGAA